MSDEDAFFHDSYTRQLEDLAWDRRWARELPGVDATREVLMGHSRGGGMVVIAAAEDSPAAIVTWAAIDEADRFDEPTKAQWRTDGELRIPNARTGQVHRIALAALEDLELHRDCLDILAAAGRLTAPLLAVHGRDDTTVPWQAAERLAERAPEGRSLVIEHANHAFNARHPMESEVPAELEHAITASLDHLAYLHTR